MKIFAMLTLAACSSPEATEASHYFDLSGWLDRETQRLSKGTAVTKTVILNDQEESMVKDGYTWEAEMESLRQWDINRAAWKGAYSADSVFEGRVLASCRYTAREDDLPVRQMEVFYRTGEVDSLSIQTRVKNPLHRTEAQYHYRRGKTYLLVQENHRRFGKDQKLEVRTTAR